MNRANNRTLVRTLLISVIIVFLAGLSLLFASNLLYEDENMLADKYFKEGILHFNSQQYTAAIEHFQKSLTEEPDFYKARSWLAKSYFYSGYIDNAFTEWKRIEQLGKMDPVFKLKLDNIMFERSIDASYEIPGPFVYQTSFPIRTKSGAVSFPTAVYSDEENKIYIVDNKQNSLLIYNINGIQESFYTQAELGFGEIYDMAFDSEKSIFLTDYSEDRIHKINIDKQVYVSFSESGEGSGLLYGPRGISVDSNDHVYVCDSGNNRVVKFDNDGNFLANIPPDWKTQDRFGTITSIACSNDLVYICDLKNHCLWVYNTDGIFQDKIADPNWREPVTLKVLEDEASLLITDQLTGIYRMNLQNREIQNIFEPDDITKAPIDAEIDHNGDLVVLDSISNNVNVYLPEKLKYSNIFVELEQTYFSRFPQITHKVRVRTKTGMYIRGLTKQNFEVEEDGNPVTDLNVRNFVPENGKVAISIVKDTHEYMDIHKDRIKKFAQHFFSNLKASDELQVIDGKNGSALQDFSNSALKALYALTGLNQTRHSHIKNHSGEVTGYDMRNGFGQALYQAIGNVNTKDNHKKAVIIITEGNLEDITFTPVGIDECIHFAKANHIPIYVVSFDDGPANPTLRRVAEESGGMFFLERTDGELAHLEKHIRDRLTDLYIVSYYTFPGDKRKTPFREVELSVQCNEMIGLDKTEYFIP